MATSKKILHEKLRNRYLEHIAEILIGEEEEVLRVKSNEIAIPCLDDEGNEEFIVITFKVPTGSRDDGEAYDGYGMATQYSDKLRDQAEKSEKAKAEKERKIARDKAMRESKARAKAEREGK